jgi:hypothetical protein
MKEDNVEQFFSDIPMGSKNKPNSLLFLAYSIRDEYPTNIYVSKLELMKFLTTYYCAPSRFEQLWNRLSEAEREMASLHFWSNGSVPEKYVEQIAEKFNLTPTEENYPRDYSNSGNALYSFEHKYAKKDSALWLLFPTNSCAFFRQDFFDLVGEMPRTYSIVQDIPTLLSRENRAEDFRSIFRFCNSFKVAATKTGVPNKTWALKLIEYCGYEDLADQPMPKLEDIRFTKQLLVTHRLAVLSRIGDLLTVRDGRCLPASTSTSLLNLPHARLVKHLFDAYLNSASFDELSIMPNLKSQSRRFPYLARQIIAKELRHCPAGQPVYTSELDVNLRLTNPTFARLNYDDVSATDEYVRNARWTEFERPLIDVILSFFGALGLVDICWKDPPIRFSDYSQLRFAESFRVNALGRYALGLSDSYGAETVAEIKTDVGFTVLPDFTVFVPEGTSRIKHELFFENLLTKVSASKQAVIYKIDFETIVRLIRSDVPISKLRDYLSTADKPLPENIRRAFDDWERQSCRIRLRKITVLECDDEALLEEVLHYKGMTELVQEKIKTAVVVDDSSKGKIQRLIEKNNRFCRDVS